MVSSVIFTSDLNVTCDLNAVGGNMSQLVYLDTFQINNNNIYGDVPEFLGATGVSYIDLSFVSVNIPHTHTLSLSLC